VASGLSRKINAGGSLPPKRRKPHDRFTTAQSRQRAQRLIQRREDRKGLIACSACFAGSAFDPSSASSAASAISTLECFTPSTLKCFSRPATLELFDLHRREGDRVAVKVVGR
jgi:hypothetical protein